MSGLQDFITAAEAVIADGFQTYTEAKAYIDFVTGVVNAATDPTDADWAKQHAYEKGELDILNKPMGGE